MRFRKLRIAWSVFCGVACILLCVLSRRSHSRWDILAYQTRATGYTLISVYGGIQFMTVDPSGSGWSYQVGEATTSPDIANSKYSWMGFRYNPAGYGMSADYFAPNWFLTLVIAAFAVAPWIRRSTRFSLRTLLIATTLVAVVLGVVVWLSRGE